MKEAYPPEEQAFTPQQAYEGAEAEEGAEGHTQAAQIGTAQKGGGKGEGEGGKPGGEHGEGQEPRAGEEAEGEHKLHVAEAEAVHTAQALERRLHQPEHARTDEAARKAFLPRHAEEEHSAEQGGQGRAEGVPVRQEEDEGVDARGNEEGAGEQEQGGESGRGAETPCQQGGDEGGEAFHQRVAPAYGLAAVGTAAPEQEPAQERNEFPRAQSVPTFRAVRRRGDYGLAAHIAPYAHVAETAQHEAEQGGEEEEGGRRRCGKGHGGSGGLRYVLMYRKGGRDAQARLRWKRREKECSNVKNVFS